MPNQVKHATSTPNHSLHKGEVAIGVNSVGMGPTSSTGWYNGHTPSSGNYIIFQTHTSGDPNIWVTNTPSELYQVVTTLGGGANDITSVGAALTWIATQSDLLALNSSLPNMVTDDLRFYWDAKLISSYSTEGVDWYDLSGKNNNGLIQNGPAFNPNGYFEFDGVDDRTYQYRTDLELTNNACTLEILIKQTGTSSGYYRFFTQSGGFGTYPLCIRGSDGYFVSYLGNTGNWAAGIPLYPDGTKALMGANAKWLHLCVVADLTITGATNRWVYLNGIPVLTKTQTWNATLSNGTGALYAAANPMGGVASMKIYNKALTQSEVLQNYYQAPIVTDGLVFAVDAGNLVSYEPGSNVAYNLTGSNISTFYNGLQYNPDNGGYFLSDGVDDALHTPDASNLDLDEFTLEGWVWWNQHKNYGSLLVKGPGGSGNIFNYCFFFYSGNIVCGFGNGGAFYNVSISTPTTNEWHHIVGTYDGATLKFYLDGTLANSSTVAQTPYQNNNDLQIIQASYPIDGRVAASRIYNRALTADEVSQNFQAQSSRFI